MRLPVAFTILLGLVDVALGVLLFTIYVPSGYLQLVAGLLVLAFVAEGIYLYFHVMSLAFGGKGLPLGRPLSLRRRMHSRASQCLYDNGLLTQIESFIAK